MATYVHGSVAAAEAQQPKQRVKVKETRKVVVRNSSLPMQEKLLYLFTVAICVIVAGVIIWRYAQIYEMNAQIHEIQTEIRALQAENSTLKEKVDRLNDPEKMRQEAQQLGMVQRNEDQTVHVTGNSAGSAKGSNTKVALKP